MNFSTNYQRDRCSNHGHYFHSGPDLGCICDDDWTDISMFALAEGPNCSITERVALILWYTTLLILILCLLPVLRHIYVIWIKKGSNLIFTTEAKSLYLLAAFLYISSFILFVVLKIIYGDSILVGRDIAISVSYVFLPLITLASLVAYFFVVITFLKSLAQGMIPEVGNIVAKRFNILSVFILLVPPLSIIFCSLPVLGIPFPKNRKIFVKVSLIGVGLLATFYGLIFLNALGFLLKELKSHTDSFAESDVDIKPVQFRLTLAYYSIACNSFGVSMTCFMFGISDFLLRKSMYLFLYQIIACALGAIILIYSVSGISSSQVSPYEASFMSFTPDPPTSF